MRRIYPPKHKVEEKNHHREETKQIINLLDKKQSFIILGPSGSGKTYLVENVVKVYLEKLSDSVFGDNRRLFAVLSMNNIGREELEIFYNSFFPQFGPVPQSAGFEVENFKNYTVDDVVEKICWGFRQLIKQFASQSVGFYIVVDNFEFMTESDIAKLMQFNNAGCVLVLASNERRFPSKFADWFADFEKVVIMPITDEKQKKYFYDSLVIGKLNLTLLAYRKLYNRLKLMYFYPGAIKKAVEKLKESAGEDVITSVDIGRYLKLHRWGLKYRDLTLGLFVFVFVLFFMRFLFLRGPESYRYAIYAGLSVMGVWFYRLFARKLMKEEEDEFVALPDYSPEWYSKYASLMSILLHISGYLLLLFVVLLITDKKFDLTMLLGIPFVFLSDIDIQSSYTARFFRLFFGDIIDEINIMFGHRGAFHSLLFVFVVSLVLFPLYFVSSWLWVSIVIALVSHLFVDALSPMGVPIFYPALHRWVTPYSFSKQIPVGSLREGSAAIAFTIICLILFPLTLITPSGIYEKITKDPFTAIKKITQKDVYLQYAVIEGFNLVNSKYITEKMKIVRSTGNELFVESSDGIVYNTKSDINVYKIVRESPGPKIEYKVTELKISRICSLDEFLNNIPDDAYVLGEIYLYSPLSEITLKTPSTMKITYEHKVLFGSSGNKVELSYANKKMLSQLLNYTPQIIRGDIEVVEIKPMGG